MLVSTTFSLRLLGQLYYNIREAEPPSPYKVRIILSSEADEFKSLSEQEGNKSLNDGRGQSSSDSKTGARRYPINSEEIFAMDEELVETFSYLDSFNGYGSAIIRMVPLLMSS